MDTHLVFQRYTFHRQGRLPRLPSALTRNFGTMNSEIPFTPVGASGRRAKVPGGPGLSAMSCSPHVMKIFWPEIQISCRGHLGFRHSLSAPAQIGTRLRFSRVHGTRPFARAHFRQVDGFQFIRSVVVDGFQRTSVSSGHSENARLAEHHFFGRHGLPAPAIRPTELCPGARMPTQPASRNW